MAGNKNSGKTKRNTKRINQLRRAALKKQPKSQPKKAAKTAKKKAQPKKAAKKSPVPTLQKELFSFTTAQDVAGFIIEAMREVHYYEEHDAITVTLLAESVMEYKSLKAMKPKNKKIETLKAHMYLIDKHRRQIIGLLEKLLLTPNMRLKRSMKRVPQADIDDPVPDESTVFSSKSFLTGD